MKKILFLLFSIGVIAAQAQTVEEVIEKYTANQGGLQAYNAVKTAKLTGTVSVQGMDLPITVVIINGKAIRNDVEVMGTSVISAYKDGKGWKQNQFAGFPDPTDITAEEIADLKSQASLASGLMDYKTRGSQVELQGQEDVEGIKTFKIKLLNKDDGKPVIYYINANDYSLLKIVSERELMGQPAQVETFFSDVKEINGAKFYMSRVQKVGGEDIQSIKFDTIEFDVPVDEKIFDKP